MISPTRPAPTVRPPSRIAKRMDLLHSDRRDERRLSEAHIVTRHYHLNSLRKINGTGHISRTEVELRAIIGEERSVTSTFVLGEDINLCRELRVRIHRTRLHDAPGHARDRPS